MADDQMVQFPLDSKFYKCRVCQTHIVSDEEILTPYHVSMTLIAKNVVNTVTEIAPDTPAFILPFAAVSAVATHCSGCRSWIGWKTVECADYVNFVRPGYYVILLNKLLFWNTVQDIDEIALHPPASSDDEEP